MKNKIAIAACALALCGCQTYEHARFDPITGKKIEGTRLENTMMWNKAAVISSITTDSNGTNKYSRTVDVKGLNSKADSEFLKAGIDAAKTVNGMP